MAWDICCFHSFWGTGGKLCKQSFWPQMKCYLKTKIDHDRWRIWRFLKISMFFCLTFTVKHLTIQTQFSDLTSLIGWGKTILAGLRPLLFKSAFYQFEQFILTQQIINWILPDRCKYQFNNRGCFWKTIDNLVQNGFTTTFSVIISLSVDWKICNLVTYAENFWLQMFQSTRKWYYDRKSGSETILD